MNNYHLEFGRWCWETIIKRHLGRSHLWNRFRSFILVSVEGLSNTYQRNKKSQINRTGILGFWGFFRYAVGQFAVRNLLLYGPKFQIKGSFCSFKSLVLQHFNLVNGADEETQWIVILLKKWISVSYLKMLLQYLCAKINIDWQRFETF